MFRNKKEARELIIIYGLSQFRVGYDTTYLHSQELVFNGFLREQETISLPPPSLPLPPGLYLPQFVPPSLPPPRPKAKLSEIFNLMTMIYMWKNKDCPFVNKSVV